MTKQEISILKNILLFSEQKEINEYKALDDIDVTYSEGFTAFIREQEQKQHSIVYKATKTVSRRIILAFAAILITFCMLMSISAIRTPVVNFFVNIYEAFTEFIGVSADSQLPEDIETICIPKYMEENEYTKLDVEPKSKFFIYVWYKNGIYIEFRQSSLDNYLTLNSEESTYDTKYINDINIYYTTNNNRQVFLWTSYGYAFSLQCSKELRWEEIEKIILSVEPIE